MKIKVKKLSKENFQKIFLILIFIPLWLLITRYKWIRPLIIPGPGLIINSFVDMKEVLFISLLSSLSMIMLGFFIGSGFGIFFGLLMAYSKSVLNVLNGFISVIRPIPIFALIPLFILWFGIGLFPQVALISFGCFVILVISTIESIRNIPTKYIRASLTLGAKRYDVFHTVIVPLIIPDLVGSIRVAAAASFGLDVAAEFMGSRSGIGYLMVVHEKYLRTEGIIACIIIFSILAYLLDKLIGIVEAHLTKWTERRMERLVTSL